MDSGKNRDCLTSLFIPIIQAIARPKHGPGCTIRGLNTECVIRWIVIERVPVCPGFRHGSSWRVDKEVLSPLNILLCVSDATAYSTLFWDGRESELKVVALQAFTNPREMGLPDEAALLKQINTQERYARFAKGRPLNQSDIAEGLTQYLRSLPRQPTRYDRSIGEPSLLSMDERAGLALFAGKAACTECHLLAGDPAAFTDQKFHHAGVGFEQIAGDVTALLGRLEQSTRTGQPLGELVLSEREIAELGRFAVTRRWSVKSTTVAWGEAAP